MKRIFGAPKPKVPPPTVQDASDKLSKRTDTLDEKIAKCDAELVKYREQMKRMKPGPAQAGLKARAMNVLKQKKMYENQRGTTFNQQFNLEQISFTTEGLRDAQETFNALKGAKKEMQQQLKSLNVSDVDNLQDDMWDMLDMGNEIQEALGQSYGTPEYVDEDDLMDELEALEADMGSEQQTTKDSQAVPSYLLPDEPSPEPAAAMQAAPYGVSSAPSAAAGVAVPSSSYGGGQGGRGGGRRDALAELDALSLPVAPVGGVPGQQQRTAQPTAAPMSYPPIRS